MFHFLRKKPFLRDLIPSNHIDIHSHLLPGIDDGAVSFENTLFLATELQKLGFEQCITTPHIMKSVWDNSKENIIENCQTTSLELKPYIEFPLRAAAEYLLDNNFVSLFQNHSLLTLKDNFVLIEISYLNPPIHLYDLLFDLQIAGYQPVLAHPERYPYYHTNFSEYEKLKQAGCLFQLNLLSTIGYYGEDISKIAEKLLQKGLIDFVGSDVHHENHILGFSKKILFKDIQPLKEAIAQNQIFRF